MSALILVTDEARCRAALADTVCLHGRRDILINNAGVGNPTPPDQMALADWHRVIDTNLTATFLLSQIAYPQLKKAGGGKNIYIRSMASYIGGARWTA
jgi:2-deoxy-D-gluconate 3-dehydrogenase